MRRKKHPGEDGKEDQALSLSTQTVVERLDIATQAYEEKIKKVEERLKVLEEQYDE